jgi:hypothetical protein
MLPPGLNATAMTRLHSVACRCGKTSARAVPSLPVQNVAERLLCPLQGEAIIVVETIILQRGLNF